MPRAPLGFCSEPGCKRRASGRCPEHRRVREAQRGSRHERGLGSEHVRLRAIVLERDGHRCHWCGRYGDTADHLVPRIRGGRSTLDNLVCACSSCNYARQDNPEWVGPRPPPR